MFKLFFLAAVLGFASAAPGYYGAPLAAPYAAPWGHGLVSSPYYGAPVVKTALPVATSYANTVRLASPAVVAAPAPYVAHAPYVTAAHAPLVAPAYGPTYAHAW